jgi:hypothetical protein
LQWRVNPKALGSGSIKFEFMKTHTTDCSGIFDVMASQVRPGSMKPETFPGLQKSDLLVRRLPAYSIRAHGQAPNHEAECMGAISSCEPEQKKVLGKLGASM